MISWGDGYTEGERGRFESVLVKDGEAVAYTDGGKVFTDVGYRESRDGEKVREFAEWYDMEIAQR